MRRHHPTSRRLRVFLPALSATLLGALLFAGAAQASFFGPEAGPTRNAQEIKNLYWIVFAIACVIFVGVMGTMIYSLIRFRSSKHPLAAQIRGNTKLEIGWTIGPAIILVALAVLTFVKLDPIRNPENSGPDGLPSADAVLTADATKRVPPNGKALDIKVNGQQYVWRYTYPTSFGNVFSYEEMVVPVNTTVILDITAQDVAHSWWIPKLGGKADAIPGYTNHTWFKVTEPGVYHGQCAELCGRNHANMIADVRVVSVPEFEAWVRRQKAAIQAANGSIAKVREQIQKSGFQPKQAAQATAPPTGGQTTP